jgi:predicted phosphodiesterase
MQTLPGRSASRPGSAQRLAALYDIHGNLPALEAVIQDVREARVDRIVVGGDVVVGPMTRETLECLLQLDIPTEFIQGNAEVAVLTEMAGTPTPFPDQIRQTVIWDAEQLRDYQAVLTGWPKTLRRSVPALGHEERRQGVPADSVLFCHATPRDENEIFLRTTSEDVLRPIFDTVNAALVVCGHTHIQFDRMVGRTRVVNAGSVGMPFQAPGAYWLLLDDDVQLRRTAYDLDSAARRIRATRYPQAEQFAANNVLRPPTEAAMLEMFSKVELRA